MVLYLHGNSTYKIAEAWTSVGSGKQTWLMQRMSPPKRAKLWLFHLMLDDWWGDDGLPQIVNFIDLWYINNDISWSIKWSAMVCMWSINEQTQAIAIHNNYKNCKEFTDYYPAGLYSLQLNYKFKDAYS